MLRISLTFLVVVMASGVSGFRFDRLMDFTINLAQSELNHAVFDPHKDADDFAKSSGESAMMALGGGLAAEKMQSRMYDKLYKEITALSHQIDELQNYVQEKLDNLVVDFRQMLKVVIKYQLELNKLIGSMRMIERKYQKFQELIQNYFSKNLTAAQRLKTRTVVDFAKHATQSNKDGLRQSIARMFSVICPNVPSGMLAEGGLLWLMVNDLNSQNHTLCGHQSAQQKLYETYKTISVVDIKGYMMMKYSFSLLSHFENKSYAEEQEMLAEDFMKRRQGYASAIKKTLKLVNRYQRACSPSSYNRDENFIELEELYGSYIINENVMSILYDPRYGKNLMHQYTFSPVAWGGPVLENPDDIFLDCIDKDCETLQKNSQYILQVTLHKRHAGFFGHHLGNQMCQGQISGCVSMGKSSWFCKSKEQSGRYGYIKTDKGQYGSEYDCALQEEIVSLEPFEIDKNTCDYCLCQCRNNANDGPKVVKWINMNDHISDIHNNMVIIGLKFEKNGTHIEIKIKEGKVESNGEVPESSWTSGFQGDPTYLEIGEADSQSLVLAHYEAKEGFVLTGLRFKHYYDQHFGIQIHSTRMDFETGKLFPLESSWNEIINKDVLGGELKIESPDIPTRSPEDFPDSMDGQYVTFRMSDLGKTAGSSVIPFIESEPVENIPGLVLNGAGLIHKGRQGYGGFVAFRVSTYDLYGHVAHHNRTISG